MTKVKKLIKKICEYCGKEFEAGKTTTRYCSHQCNSRAYKEIQRGKVVQLTETLTGQKKEERVKTDLSDRPYISISEAAKLMGVSRWTIYRYVVGGKIPSIRITQRTTRIRRADLELFFDNVEPYKINHIAQQRPITEWYTLSEITEKYGIKYRRIRDIINKENIPEKKYGKLTLIDRNKIDVYFKKQGYNETTVTLTDWITFSEIMQQYEMTENTAYSFVSDYNIPKKQQNGKRYYSKQHIDTIKYKGQ